MGEAVLIDRVDDRAGAVRDGEERHELGLHVGRETRIGRGGDRDRSDPFRSPDADARLTDLNRCAGLLELGDGGIEVPGFDARRLHFPAGDRGGGQERAGLDTVRNHRRVGRIKPVPAGDHEPRRAHALDPRAHGREESRQRLDLGFARGIFDHRLPLGRRRGHEDVSRRSHARDLEGDDAPLEAVTAGDDIPVLDFHIGPDPVRIRRMLERPFGSVRWKEETPDRAASEVLPVVATAAGSST